MLKIQLWLLRLNKVNNTELLGKIKVKGIIIPPETVTSTTSYFNKKKEIYLDLLTLSWNVTL